MNKSGELPGSSPKKSGGATPTMLTGSPFTMIVFPATSRLSPNRFQNVLDITAVAGADS
jgi:hypothetical protein